MKPPTYRLYTAILGIGSIYLGYAFLRMHRTGLYVFLLANAVEAANFIAYFNWGRGIALAINALFVGLVLWAWSPLLKRR